jgi:hypothetical protein
MNTKLKSLVRALKQTNDEETEKALIVAIIIIIRTDLEKAVPKNAAPKGYTRTWMSRLGEAMAHIGKELVKHELAGAALHRIREILIHLFY